MLEKNTQLMRVEPARPLTIPSTARSYATPVPETELSLRHFVAIIGRHKLLLAAFVIVGIAVSTTICMLIPPVYEATAQVEVDRRSALEGLNQAESLTSAVSDMDQIVTTQLQLVVSDPVLRPVVEKFDLLRSEGQLAGRFGKPLTPGQVKRVETGPVQLRRLSVKRPPNTYLINISYRAQTPNLAADVANTIAAAYVDYVGHLHAADSNNMKATMVQQKSELEARIAQSNERITALTKELNVLDPEQRTSILSSRLSQLTNEYTLAQSDRARKEAELQVVKSGSLSAAQSSTHGDALNRLIEKRNDLRQRLADVKTTYGDRYPEYQRLSNLLREVERQIGEMQENIQQRTDSAYEQAAKHEQGIKTALDQTTGTYEGLAPRIVEYQRLKQQADIDKKNYDDLVQRIRDTDINLGYQRGVARMANPALPPTSIAFPKIPLVLSVSILLSILTGLGVVILTDAIESRISGAETAARYLSISVIAKLPVIKRHVTIARLAQAGFDTEEKSLQSLQWFHEGVRTLMNTLNLSIDPERTRTVLLTSSTSGEGKSTVSAHLALASARMRRKTLLIDADMRRGTAHRLFQIPLGGGLASVLEGRMDWRSAVIPIEGQSHLRVLPAGRMSQLAFEQCGVVMPELLAEMGREYDLVLIDAPPLALAETVQLANMADGVIVVAHADKTTASSATNLIGKLNDLNINILGMVLNHSKEGMFGGYYNSYYYGYRNKKKLRSATA